MTRNAVCWALGMKTSLFVVISLSVLVPATAWASPAADPVVPTPEDQYPLPEPAPDRPQKRATGGPCRESDDSRDVCRPRDIFFMPGLSAVAYFPRGSSQDPFMGGGVQLTPLRWSHNNDHFGPSQGELFVQASILQSVASESTLSLFDVGYTLSFERNSSRNFLIPYFGGTLGGLAHRELGDSAYTYQFAGAHFVWHQNFVVSGEGGYQFPFSRVDVVRGPRAQLSAGFSMW